LTYKNELLQFSDSSLENSCIITFLIVASFLTIRATCISDVLSLFIISKCIYQDMLLARKAQYSFDSSFKENIILCPFISINVDMEFRDFSFSTIFNLFITI